MDGSAPDTTFLFTDIEESTRRWELQPTQMTADLAVHDRIIQEAVDAHGGTVFKHTGDGLCAVFHHSGALAAAIVAQQALAAQEWLVDDGIRARMGLHRGQAIQVGNDFFGPPLNRVARIMSAGHGGQVLVSEAALAGQAELPHDWQVVDLGAHELRDLIGSEHLHQVTASGMESTFPPLRVLASYRHNLPAQLTRLVGRDDDIETVAEMLGTHRLVTLTGVGGCGKSRLALQVAAESLPRYVGGVWLVSLATQIDPRYVAMTIASTVGYNERLAGIDDGDQPAVLRQIAEGVGDAAVLIVLDNCEHLIQSVAEAAATLLAACPNLAILATSREVLKIAGEQVLAVPPLDSPDESADAETVLATASGQLFAERAAAVRPDFVVSDVNASPVASICRRLDGLPLAIELAAARIRMLDPVQIDARLGQSLRLLASGDRTASDRHRTLLATMEWSHDLLNEDERIVLRRLAVFSGGATLEAAEAVCGGPPLSELDVLETIGSLLDRSLLTITPGDPARYGLLEVVRQFADQKLIDSGEADAVRRNHFEWALSLAERTGPIEWYAGTAELQPERHNLRAAFQSEHIVGVTGEDRLRFAYALWRYMAETAQIPEGQAMLEEALASDHLAGTEIEARVLDAAAFFAALRGEYNRALTMIDLAIERCHALGDPLNLGWALYRKSTILGLVGDCRAALSPAIEARRLFDAERYGMGQVWVNFTIARLHVSLDDVSEARRALACSRSTEPHDDLSCLSALTIADHSCDVLAGDLDAAASLINDIEALVEFRMQHTTTQALQVAVPVLVSSGCDDAARPLLAELLAATHVSGSVSEAIIGLTWSAELLLDDPATHDQAVAIKAFVDASRDRIGMVSTPLFERTVASRLSSGRPSPSGAPLHRAPLLNLDDAIRSARRILDETAMVRND